VIRVRLLLVAVLSAAATSPALATPPPAPPAPAEDPLAILPQGEGRETFVKVCSGCHVPTIVARQRHTADGWTDVVVAMIGKGAKGSDDEFEAAIAYLAKAFPQEGAAAGHIQWAEAPVRVQEKR